MDLQRRDFLKAGMLSGLGLGLADYLRLSAAGQVAETKAKSAIFISLGGGPTHVETFDPKMTAPSEYRSVTGEESTIRAEVIFGADGVFSTVRQQMNYRELLQEKGIVRDRFSYSCQFVSIRVSALALSYWLPTPLTDIFKPYKFLLAVMNNVCRSFPPKHTLAVQPPDTSICSICFPDESKTKTPVLADPIGGSHPCQEHQPGSQDFPGTQVGAATAVELRPQRRPILFVGSVGCRGQQRLHVDGPDERRHGEHDKQAQH